MNILSLLPIVFTIGVIVGLVGIGGVLLVPLFVLEANISPHDAIAVSLVCLVFSGIGGLLGWRRSWTDLLSELTCLSVGAMSGAVAGALLMGSVPAVWLSLMVCLVLLLAGLGTGRVQPRAVQKRLPRTALLATGVTVGFGSALTGTGGPVLLIPVMAILGQEVRRIVPIGVILQIPIAGVATLTLIATGSARFDSALLAAAAMALGTFIGVLGAQRVEERWLRSAVRAAIALAAILMLLRTGRELSVFS